MIKIRSEKEIQIIVLLFFDNDICSYTVFLIQITVAGNVDEPHNTLAIVLGLLVSILLLATGIVLLVYKG